jgi:hypothetical protein
MSPKCLGSTLLLTLLLAFVGSCDTSQESNITADEQPTLNVVDLRESTGAAFLVNQAATAVDTVTADHRVIMVGGERLQLRRVQEAPR